MRLTPAFLLLMISTSALAQTGDPVLDHAAAHAQDSAAFNTIKAERDKAWNDNAVLTSQTNQDATRIGILQNDLGKVISERDAALKALAACKVAPGCYTPPAPPPPPPPAPAPTPAPVPPPVVDTTTIPAPIPSNFDVNSELVKSWGTGAIPPSAAPDVVGAFRFICTAGQLISDDPIMYPGKPGKSHLHQFFGNLAANAHSTYASLRTTGDSTCTSKLNRSGYWIPAMITASGSVVRPDYISIYYKRRPKTDPLCAKIGSGGCVDLPRGLRFIFGANMLDMAAPKTGGGYFNCQGTGGTPGHYKTLPEVQAKCPVTAQIGAVISAPECWDGKNLDSADHRSHVAYSKYIGQSYAQCPSTHPYVIPTFTLGAWYSQGSIAEPWHMASDEMPDGTMMTPGSSFHADWWGAWDDSVMAMWSDNCINKLLNCSGGDLGNGKQMKTFVGFSYIANPRVVPRP